MQLNKIKKKIQPQFEFRIAKHQIKILVNACCASDELKFVHGGSIDITTRLLVGAVRL